PTEKLDEEVPEVASEVCSVPEPPELPAVARRVRAAEVRQPGPRGRPNEEAVMSGEGVIGEAASVPGERPGPGVFEEGLVRKAEPGPFPGVCQDANPDEVVDECRSLLEERGRHPEALRVCHRSRDIHHELRPPRGTLRVSDAFRPKD